VLRHFNLRTEFVDRAMAILIPFDPFDFNRALALRYRAVLESILTKTSLLSNFEALVRLDLGDAGYAAVVEEEEEDEETPYYFTGDLDGTAAKPRVDAATFPFFPKDQADPNRIIMIEKGSNVTVHASGGPVSFENDRNYGPEG